MSRIVTSGRPLDPARIFQAQDQAARKVARQAGQAALAVVRPRIPRQTGRGAEQTRVRVRTDIEGHHVTVGPSRDVAWRLKFVESGTGIYGPRHQLIRPRHAQSFRLPGGVQVEHVRGQRARHMFRSSKPAADRAFEEAVRAGLAELDAAAHRAAA